MTLEDKKNLSLTNKGIIIKVYDDSNNLVNKFPSIKEAAKHFFVGERFIRKCVKNNKPFQGLLLKSEFKNKKVSIFNDKFKLIEVLDNAEIVSNSYGIPKTTLYRYIKKGKLYKDKYYIRACFKES
jgi:hypothetical protein